MIKCAHATPYLNGSEYRDSEIGIKCFFRFLESVTFWNRFDIIRRNSWRESTDV